MFSGHAACPGCGAALAMRYLLKGLGPETIMAMPACCWAVIGGAMPSTALNIALQDCAFEATGAAVSGIRAGLDAQGLKGVTVVGFAGDGGTADIGLQALSGMLERRTDAIYVMYDNEAYMNTGIQRSGATPKGAWTTTTPTGAGMRGKEEQKKDILAIVMAHEPSYAATANVAFPEDFVKKAKRAAAIEGPRFLHVLAPCPPGWRFDAERTVEIGRLATDANIFPLLEYAGGEMRLTRKPSVRTPVEAYLKAQGRFGHMNADEVRAVQEATDRKWAKLLLEDAEAAKRAKAAKAVPVAP
ncbi:MAG TPA: thiamine pyrophosphate-dependent enzyme [Candidatus Thermoplasmatota archaeon]|nr:thiamine pyrophosphate-dependent enzyme [Candidatus Thermoplasmatota archaeon]